MKNLFILLVATLTFASCKENYNRYDNAQVVVNQPTISVTPEVANLGDNLNLQALGELVKNSTSAQDIEDKLNSNGSINNLDLDGDGSVDYIKVTEYGNGNQKGFSFTVDTAEGETQEIATIEVAKGSNNAQMNIQGNQQLYGNNGYYQSNYSLTDMMIMSYLFSPHPYYHSPYRYGYYPSYYRSYRSTPYHSYRNRMSTTTRTTKITRTIRPNTTTRSISSPNANKSVSSVTTRAKSLSTPTRSQKSFTTTSASRQRPSTSGFSNKRSSGSSNSYSSSKPRKSSGSSWGSSSSSRKSSGSSWGSSSRSSSRSSGSSSRSSSRRR